MTTSTVHHPLARHRVGGVATQVTSDDVAAVTSDVQKAHRRAATGMSLRHSGHSCVSGFVSSLGTKFSRFISAVSGTTTAKKTTVATMRNETSALRNEPYLNVEWLRVNVRLAKLGLPKMAAISGVIEVGHEGRDHCREGDADHHRDGQVHDVAPQDELLEIRKHRHLPARVATV